jgi:hypothetical protein
MLLLLRSRVNLGEVGGARESAERIERASEIHVVPTYQLVMSWSEEGTNQ